MRTYTGRRIAGDGCRVNVDGSELPIRRDLLDHSLDFEWGYAGSGPAQLALALLADYMQSSSDPDDCESEAVRLHQQFKLDVVTRLPHERWLITSDQIRDNLRRIRGQLP